MDMKKIPKSRMEDFERRQQREREKHKRQQVQSVGREHALFPEPRRVNPSEVDDDITAKLGDHSKAIEFMTTEGVGVQPSSNNALLSSHIQTSASSSAGGNNIGNVSMSTNLLPPSHRSLAGPAGSQTLQQTTQQTHHYQQPLRQQSYLKQSDNKPPYNGRGSYSNQPVKNDLRPSSGMAPPKGPPPLLPPPSGTICGSSSSSTSLLPPPSNGYLGPPKSTAPLHNGRFPKPLPKSINDIISKVDQTYRAPEQITKIAATPRTSIADYNLNGPNRHKYSVGPVQPILGSPPSGADLLQSAVPLPITPISALPATPNPQIISNACGITSSGMSTIMPNANQPTAVVSAVLNSPLVTTAVRQGLMMPKEPLKPLLEQVGPLLEKQNSTLENDLELSESDDDRRKQSRSVHNSSDSSQSDSSESGSEESSKSETQRSTHSSLQQQTSIHHQNPLSHNSLQQQHQQSHLVQQIAQTVGRSVASKVVNDKSKMMEPLGGSRSNIYLNTNALGSAGSSSSGPSSTSSSSNKTPSPSDSSKWHLSRYFNKKPAQSQNVTTPPANSLVVNSINVSMDEPTLLPGGAQIIPEATQPQLNPTIVKHENSNYGVAKKFSSRSDDDDDETTNLRNCEARSVLSNSSGVKTHMTGGVSTFINEIKKEADVLYPSSLKASTSNTTQAHAHVSSQQQQTQVPLLNAAEFVAIPTSQIKHEVPGLSTVATSTIAPMSLAGGTTTVTPYNSSTVKVSGNGHRRTPSASPHMRNSVATGNVQRRIDKLSAPSSDGATSNSSDDEDALTTSTRSTVPTLGPGGTLKIPGVPAAITALPPSTSQPLASAPTLPNSITVLPINPLTKTTPSLRRKKPRNSVATITTQLDTSDEEDMVSMASDFKSGGVTVSPTELRAVAGAGGKLYSEPMPVVPAKKGPGRPRKTAGSGKKPNTTTIAPASKGPKLTANKDVNSSAVVGKKTTAKRRASRQNSNSTGINPMKPHSQPTQSALSCAPIIDSSSSGSMSYSTSKSSSSSSSETECEDGIISGSSSGDDNKMKGAGATKTKRNLSARKTAAAVTPSTACSVTANTLPASTSRIIVQLNRRKSSHDDAPPIAISSVNTSGSSKVANSGKRKRSTSHFINADEEADSDDDSSDSGSCSYGSSVKNYNAGTTTANSITQGGNTSGGSSHRSQNLQSPYKVPIPAAPVSSSTSSSSSVSSSSSSSSGDEHFDTEPTASVSNRGKSKHSKTGTKVTTNVSSSSNSSRLRRDNPKPSDKNKNVTLTRIFNPKEGGAKKQGQVMVIDEQQQQKLISPNASGYRTTVTPSSTLSASQENLVAAASLVNSQSPRLTPGHIKSPRTLPQPAGVGSHRTPDRSSRNSAERKVQQQRIRTPSCTPTRTPPMTRTPTPTPASLLSAPTASPMRNTATILPNVPTLICKVDLSRLQRILPEWRTNTYRLSNPSMPRCAQHEAILNADLQATSAITGYSGSVGAYNSGNRTPTTPTCPPERELSRSRECLVGIGGSGSKQRLNTMHSTGRLSNRSTDGDDTTPKQQSQLTPNGYNSIANVCNSSPSTKQLLKHEQLIKNEPGSEIDSGSMSSQQKTDAYCSETKFKTSGSVKQELMQLKQDCKPGLPPQIGFISADKDDDRPDASPNSQQMQINDITEPKSQRRKRSASSSPYKDKKRKKEKTDKYSKDSKDGKEGKEIDVGSGTLLTMQDKEKDMGKSITALAAIERDIGSNAIGSGHTGANDTSRRAIAIIPPLGMNNGQMEKDHQLMENRQLAPTNHDRLLVVRQIQQQQQHHISNTTVLNSSQNLANTQTANNNLNTTITADIATSNIVSPENLTAPLAPPPQVIYRSYFERDDDGLCDDISKNSQFLQEAVTRKHAADKEQNLFNQVTLYLEAVTYFILSGAVLERHRNSEDASWVMYKDTLNLIKFISSKIKHLQVSSTSNELHEPHNKVAILSLRCQSLISLKLYKLKRNYCRNIINNCTDYLKSGRMEILNGNTPSSNSPSNSVCSQGSGSNTPPGRGKDIHTTFSHQNLYFNYLANCHDLWDQADRLVRQGNHTDFFIALDRENGPITLHTSMYDLFRYVQSGLKQLKSANTTTTTSSTTNTSGCSASGTTTDNVPMACANSTTTLSNTTTITTTTINKNGSAMSSVTLQPQ